MIQKIEQYSVDSSDLDMVTKAITELLDGIRRNEPYTRYEAYRIKGTNTFLHFMIFTDEQTEQAHRNAAYTIQFTEIVYPLCKEKPVITDLDRIEGMIGGEYE